MSDGIRIPVPLTQDRVVLFGNSREGKSQLAKSLLRAKPHAIVIDTKMNEDWTDVGQYVDGNAIYKVGGGRFVWRPGYDVSQDELDKFFGWALKYGNRVIYVDEIIDVAISAVKYPRNYRRAVKTGASGNLGVWGSTQEPRGIPLWTAGQANYIFTFHVGLPEYRQRIDEFFEQRVPWNELPTKSWKFVWKDERGMHGPTFLNLKHPNAPRPTMQRRVS